MEKAETSATAQSDCDSLPAFKLLVSCPSGILPSQFSVKFGEAYDRIPHPNSNLEKSISEIWDQRTQRSKSLFNGQKFRYAGHDGHGSNQGHVCLHIGLTDYRTFVGTNLSPFWERFLVPAEGTSTKNKCCPLTYYSLNLDDSVCCQHTASPLGNGAIVETSDKRILVLKRSDDVGEFPGHFVFPGGHPEPEEVGIAFHQDWKNCTDSELINKKVSQEMFDSIIREVVEEIGVPAASLCEPIFIGVSRRELNMRPAAMFFIKCTLESEKIQQLYSSAQDGYESTQLYAVSMIDVDNMACRMPGCHQGGLALYKLMIEAQKDM